MIESTAIRQNGAVEVSSVSQTGYGRVTVQYDWSKDMDEAFLDLQKSLSAFSSNAEIDEFVISQFDPNAAPILIWQSITRPLMIPKHCDVLQITISGTNSSNYLELLKCVCRENGIKSGAGNRSGCVGLFWFDRQ